MDCRRFRVLIIDDDISFELARGGAGPDEHGRFADELSQLEQLHPEIEVYGMRTLPGRSGRVIDGHGGTPAVRLTDGTQHEDLLWTECDVIICDLKFRADDAHSPYTALYVKPPALSGINAEALEAHWDTLLERAQGCVFLFHALARKQLHADTLFALLTANDEDPAVDAVLDDILSPDAGLDVSRSARHWPWTLKFGKTPSHNSASHNRSGIQQLVVALRCKFRAWQVGEVLDGQLMNNMLLYGNVSDSQLVLILGESGTGKERVARELALLWQERFNVETAAPLEFIPVNCANLRREFAQSELFGHVRGAYTGADSARAGVFLDAAVGTRLSIPNGKNPQTAFISALKGYLVEDADNVLRLNPLHVRPGVLFLDEIGDLPQDVQEMLLRALAADCEIEPLGLGRRIRGVRPRVIAATSDPEVARLCDYVLAGESRGKPQRSDLYRRFAELGNIIRVPPFTQFNLRPRVEALLRRRPVRWGASACDALIEHLGGLLEAEQAARPFGQWRDVLSLVKEIELRWRDAEAIGLRNAHAGRMEVQRGDVERYVRSRRGSSPPTVLDAAAPPQTSAEAHDDHAMRSFFAGLDRARQEFARGLEDLLPSCALPLNWDFTDLVSVLELAQDGELQLRIKRTFRDTLRRYIEDSPDFVGSVFKQQIALGSGTPLTRLLKQRDQKGRADISWFFDKISQTA